MREAFSEEMYSTAEGSIGCRLDLSWASLSRMAQPAGQGGSLGTVIFLCKFAGGDLFVHLLDVARDLYLVVFQHGISDARSAGEGGEGNKPHDHAHADLVAGETLFESFHGGGGREMVR